MSTELIALAAAGALNILLVLSQGAAKLSAIGARRMAAPRDDETGAGLPPIAGRLERALRNFLETAPAFIALVLAVELSGRSSDLSAVGAWMYVAGRAAHAPLYAVGATYVRAAAWWTATVGLLLLGVALATPGGA